MDDAPPADASRAPSQREAAGFVHLHLATLYDAGLGTALLDAFGTPEAVLSRSRRELEGVAGMTRGALSRLLDPGMRRRAERELAEARHSGVEIAAWGRSGYPAALGPLPGMPVALYRAPAAWAPNAEGIAVGLVGSRRPSPYGLRQARRFAAALAARGLTIVSGLAIGIDGEAHRAALDAGGRTIAVLGSGLARIYPPENRELARRIAASGRGALVSEFPFAAAPRSFHFPMRNRVLSGLSAAVLVVEAGEKSGSLITVRHALDQGRAVYVVPGRVDSPQAMGCLRLLQDGATPAIEPGDVLPGVGSPGPAGEEAAPTRRRLGGPLGDRLDALFAEEDCWHPDALAARLDASPAEILSELARLELEGLLRRLPGGSYAIGSGAR
jgi:DNA processing protein